MAEQAEGQNVNVLAVSALAASTVGALILIVAALALLFPVLIHRPMATAKPFPAPSVMTDEGAQRAALERAQRARLQGGNGAMPIANAMAVIARRGAQAYDPPANIPP